MISIAICDDDENFIQYIKDRLQEAGLSDKDTVYYEYLSGEELISDFDKNIEYDLLILDVLLQGMDGNEVAMKFREKYLSSILVFCSNEYKPEPSLFKVSPFRYLLKQYTEDTMVKELQEIVTVLKQREKKTYIVGNYYSNVLKLQPQEIMYVSIAKVGSNIYLSPNISQFEFEDHIRCKKKLSEIYQILKNYDFVYIHNSYIVNMNYIKRKTTKEIELTNGEILTVSRSKEKEFRDRFMMFLEDKYN